MPRHITIDNYTPPLVIVRRQRAREGGEVLTYSDGSRRWIRQELDRGTERWKTVSVELPPVGLDSDE